MIDGHKEEATDGNFGGGARALTTCSGLICELFVTSILENGPVKDCNWIEKEELLSRLSFTFDEAS